MNEVESLYQDIIVDHVKHPRRQGLRDGATVESHQLNPTCGDEITLQLVLDGDRIVDAAWTGRGCMVSQSSASILAEQLPGLTAAEAGERIESFRASMRSRGEIPVDEDLLGDAVALEGAAKFVARVKCAMLAWVAAEDALAKR
ncbi:MAG: SUF system NifU family Fe-S cluster assembly protein [Micrococcales bacterium 73-13]|nr:MAG: SUF system NifU family Fe-S cluster assembly protein [Micrococcales bacterium 73-13]